MPTTFQRRARAVPGILPGKSPAPPTVHAALKCLYMAIMSLDPTGKGRKRWTNRWKAALNAFDITFDGGLSAGRK